MTPVVTHLPLAAQPVMPWANGGGSTRQVAIDPPGGSLANGCRWRISIAQVGSDGPFSVLPGIDRSLWLLRGAGFRLDVGGRDVVLDRRLQRLDFRGETPITCRLLAGPCEDLNVMVARAHVRAGFDLCELRAEASFGWSLPDQGVAVVLQGAVQPLGRQLVGAGEALRVDGAATLALRAVTASTVLFATFRRVEGAGA